MQKNVEEIRRGIPKKDVEDRIKWRFETWSTSNSWEQDEGGKEDSYYYYYVVLKAKSIRKMQNIKRNVFIVKRYEILKKINKY